MTVEGQTVDVLILGAGPAGSTAAHGLARQGLSVTLIDRANGPGFKVGESLLPEGVRICHEMGLSDALASGSFLRKEGARFVLSEDGAEDRFAFAEALRAERGDFAYQVQRLPFDALLQEQAVRVGGATLRWNVRARELQFPDADHVELVTADGERLRARYLIDATGQAHLLARQFGLRRPMPGLGKLALFSHFRGIPRRSGPEAGDITVVWNPSGWFWVIPFADGTTSVGVVGDPAAIDAAGTTDQARFDALCRQSRVHRDLLAEREQLLPLHRRADFSYHCATRMGDRYLLLGDAAGFIDPIFSTGVFLAQSSAWRAAEVLGPALLAGQRPAPEVQREYELWIDRALRRYQALVLQFYDRTFMDDIVRARRRRETRRALTSLLAGDIHDEDNPILRMGMLDRTGGE